MPYILILPFFALFHSAANATVIGAIRTPETVIIAVDSGISNPTSGGRLGTFCKVRNYGVLVAGLTGVLAFLKADYDPFEIIRSGVKGEVTEQTIEALETRLRTKLLQAARGAFFSDRRMYKESFLDNTPLAVFFAWVRNGVPVLKNIQFTLPRGSMAPTTIYTKHLDCPGPSPCNDGVMLLLTATVQDATEYYRSLAPTSVAKDPLESVRTYIDRTIRQFPDKLSEPIQIIEVSNDGPRWINRPEICPETEAKSEG